jgi:hypothetical protein
MLPDHVKLPDEKAEILSMDIEHFRIQIGIGIAVEIVCGIRSRFPIVRDRFTD